MLIAALDAEVAAAISTCARAAAREKARADGPTAAAAVAALGTRLIHPFRDPLPQVPVAARHVSGAVERRARLGSGTPTLAHAYPPPGSSGAGLRVCANGHYTTDRPPAACRLCGAPLSRVEGTATRATSLVP